MKNPIIHILLSTYNGEKYLEKQLGSIICQSYKNYVIHVRDDGSKDKTKEILNYWKDKHPEKFDLNFQENIGVINSFLSLLEETCFEDGDIFAFCDQDDFWHPEKLKRTVSAFSQCINPNSTLYCSRLEYVDDSLTHLHYSLIPKKVSFNNAIVENIATGCTVAFGKEIRNFMLEADTKHMMMHDWWAYLIASAFGEVIYDEEAMIKYRQHSGSVTPWEHGLSKISTRAINLYKRLTGNFHQGLESLNQATHFIETYEDQITDDHKELVDELLELRKPGQLIKRIKYISKPRVYRTDTLENISLKPMILFGLH